MELPDTKQLLAWDAVSDTRSCVPWAPAMWCTLHLDKRSILGIQHTAVLDVAAVVTLHHAMVGTNYGDESILTKVPL